MISKLLRALGKSSTKVTAVFAQDRASADLQVSYLRSNLTLPIWLFTLEEPSIETASQCASVVTSRSAGALWFHAQQKLWPYQVALALADWNGKRGGWPLKLAPLTIPFFRALFRNQEGEYFPGSPRMIALHTRLTLTRQLSNLRISAGEVALGSAIWVFAFTAQWCSPLSRFVFRRIRPTAHLTLNAPAQGTGIAHYRYTKREWNPQRIQELLRHSGAEYIFFQRDDDHSATTDLLSAFHNPDTFVASSQNSVRSWRKLLFATAPFRQLAPGELTRVHAPVSAAMLVSAAKLRALHLPELSSFGSSWYALFHQAAAAGWPSYSVAGPHIAAELAAVPFDEAQFVITLLAEPELRRLAPRLPALAQGNIAQSLHPGPGFRELPRVLIVSPYLPFPLSHGGAVRIWNLCRALSGQVDFVLACFREHSETVNYPKLHEVFREIYVVDIDEKHRNAELPSQVNGYESSTMRALIARLCQQQPIAVLQLEYTQLAAYREAAPATPALLVEHDLTFTLYRQLAATRPTTAAHQEYQRWLNFERERLRAFHGIWTMSQLDRTTAIEEGSPPDRTYAIPNGVDLERFRCPPAHPASQQILYVGSFRHLPNYLAFEELRDTIMAAVWSNFPEATLQVVAGPKHTDHWPGSRTLDPRITVHGFVEDLLPLYTEAAIVVVPLPISAGTNIKLMEALACNRPVVTTPVGCAGLELVDNRDVLIRELGFTFANAICKLLADPTLRTSIATAGLAQAQERFGWSAIAQAAYLSYSAINPSWPLSHSPSHSAHRPPSLPA